MKEKLLKCVLPTALGMVIVIGAFVCAGLAARPDEVPPAAQTDAPAAEPAAVPQPVRTPDPQPAESPAPKEQKTETTPAAIVESPEEPEEVPAEAPPQEEQPAPAPKPRIVYSQEALDEKITAITASIVTEDMNKRDQAYAVFNYVNTHVRYVGTSNKNSWQEGAFEGLTTGRGDCYTYYALSRALLSALGIDNLEVRRVGGTTSHYWNLVNCGDGWYHFDAGPHVVPMPNGSSFFMFTDDDAAAYTEAAGKNYYVFDGSLYPARGYVEPAPEPEAPAEPELPEGELVPEDPEQVPGDTETVPENPEAIPGDTGTVPGETVLPEDTIAPEEQSPSETPQGEPAVGEPPANGEEEFPSEPWPAPEVGAADEPETPAEDEPPVIIESPPVSV